jgi:sugar lactone lactonase YvrE
MHKTTLTFFSLMLFLFVGVAHSPVTATPAPVFPDIIPLPDGFQPEGVAVGSGPVIYAGSLANGDIYRANLRTGEGEIIIEGSGLPAVGLAYDQRSGYLFVSGGPVGEARVYDTATGELLQTYPLSGEHSFINDVVVTREAAYFTNSFQPELYRLPLGPGGQLPDPGAVETIALSGPAAFDPVPAPNFIFNTNGIVATPDGRYLIIVNSTEQAIYRVDPATGESALIDIGGPLPAGDGLVLQGKTLYVVQNQLNQIAVIRLATDFLSGEVVETITDPNFVVPTTADIFGNRLYAVNAKFGTPPTPTTPYEIVQVQR